MPERLRGWIDRQFFREAYEADAILTDLATKVRTMVETGFAPRDRRDTHRRVAARVPDRDPARRRRRHVSTPVRPWVCGRRRRPGFRRMARRSSRSSAESSTPSSNSTTKIPGSGWRAMGERDAVEAVVVGAPPAPVAQREAARDHEPGPEALGGADSANDLRLLKSVAAQTGLALENRRLTETIAAEGAALKERLNRELEIAREVQERLFPQEFPPSRDLDYIGACRPALGVGGDYYDFLELPGKLGIAIGDVSGKGIGRR